MPASPRICSAKHSGGFDDGQSPPYFSKIGPSRCVLLYQDLVDIDFNTVRQGIGNKAVTMRTVLHLFQFLILHRKTSIKVHDVRIGIVSCGEHRGCALPMKLDG